MAFVTEFIVEKLELNVVYSERGTAVQYHLIPVES